MSDTSSALYWGLFMIPLAVGFGVYVHGHTNKQREDLEIALVQTEARNAALAQRNVVLEKQVARLQRQLQSAQRQTAPRLYADGHPTYTGQDT
jgi:uncharacterized protein HemX